MIDENELEDSLRVCREIESFRITDDLAMQNQLNNPDLFHNETLWEVDKVLNESLEEKQAPESEPVPEQGSEQDTTMLEDALPAGGEQAEESNEGLVSVPVANPVPEPVAEKTARKKTHKEKPVKKKKDKKKSIKEKPVQKVAVANPVYVSANNDEMQEEYIESHPFLRTLLGILVCIVIALILSLVITKYVAYHTSVEGSSMEATLNNGDQLIVEKLSYYFNDPERYDVIVFPFSENVSYIKRIIGLPGEIIQIKNGEVYLNGELLEDDFGKEERIEDPGLAEEEIVLAEDEYFVLGDNRNASVDSRREEVGLIKRSQIEGKAWVRFYPFDSISTVH